MLLISTVYLQLEIHVILCLCVPFMIFGGIETACKWSHVAAETRCGEMYNESISELCRLCNLLSLYVIGEIERKHLRDI